jgi:hypothetical protein
VHVDAVGLDGAMGNLGHESSSLGEVGAFYRAFVCAS